MLPYDVGLPIAVRYDECDVPVLWHDVECLEAQRGLFNPAVVIVRGYRLTGGDTHEADGSDVGKDTDWDAGEMLVHDLALQPFSGDIPQGLDSGN